MTIQKGLTVLMTGYNEMQDLYINHTYVNQKYYFIIKLQI